MGKRKRESIPVGHIANGAESFSGKHVLGNGTSKKIESSTGPNSQRQITVQIVIGTYEKVLHGLRATISSEKGLYRDGHVEFENTFLFNAHGSAIRCLAVSPATNETDKVFLASGGSDQVVNLYSLSTISLEKPSTTKPVSSTPGLTNMVQNRELGSLQHHAGGINALFFASKSKLLTAADDNTIAVARTRDWTVLSTIKAPNPRIFGHASGDTAPLRASHTGVNDFAVHPSMKLMISVGKGEKCMRLWNLVTGKRAAVLNFDRNHLHEVGEGKYSSGEGRRVSWDSLGEEFVVGFDHGCLIYGIDSKPKGCILPSPKTRIQQVQHFTFSSGDTGTGDLVLLSTDDGRILFYHTKMIQSSKPTESHGASSIPQFAAIAQLGGLAQGIPGRIKDFEILSIPDSSVFLIVTGSSDGAIRLWHVASIEISESLAQSRNDSASTNGAVASITKLQKPRRIGNLVKSYEAGNRITCLRAFLMSTQGFGAAQRA